MWHKTSVHYYDCFLVSHAQTILCVWVCVRLSLWKWSSASWIVILPTYESVLSINSGPLCWSQDQREYKPWLPLKVCYCTSHDKQMQLSSPHSPMQPICPSPTGTYKEAEELQQSKWTNNAEERQFEMRREVSDLTPVNDGETDFWKNFWLESGKLLYWCSH